MAGQTRHKSHSGDTWAVSPLRKVPLLFIAAFLALVLGACGGGSDSGGGSGDQAKAIAEAKVVFRKAQSKGDDLNAGPCIAQTLPGLPDWAADVAHDPRQPVDDQPANQCQSYR